MNVAASPVTVYAFLKLDDSIETPVVAPFKATREAILRRYGGQVLEGTAERVDADALDAEGRLVRVPTGWGDLAPC
jgi:hypothetical protein